MNTDTIVRGNERFDDLNLNNLKIIQNSDFFCFGIDSVLLSNFAKVKKNELVLDLGTGNGIIPILLSAKTLGRMFIGIEIQKECVDMANRSVIYNNLTSRIKIMEGDIKDLSSHFDNMSFDVITTNPPYMPNGDGIICEYNAKSIARHELLCNLEDVISGSSKLLKNNGRFYMVHRPHRLVDILSLMRKYRIEPKLIKFVQASLDKQPNMVLIEGVKNGGAWLTVSEPLIIYND
jgi:tRNA1Val (adenine37-N6)-methyltransferase